MKIPSRSAACMPEGHKNSALLFMLWFINKHKMHGYEIIKHLKEDGFSMATPARVYTLLSLMKQEELISQKNIKQGKRVRKVYTITSKGKKFIIHGKKFFSGVIAEFLKDMIS